MNEVAHLFLLPVVDNALDPLLGRVSVGLSVVLYVKTINHFGRGGNLMGTIHLSIEAQL